MGRYLDDYRPGETERFGAYAVTRESILAFAEAYDPQAFHLSDEGGAANPLFGSLVASGWQTAAIAMRLMVDHRRERGDLEAVLAGAGIDELRWLKPVYPGDVLALEIEVLAVTPSRSDPTRGMLRGRSTLFNQKGEAVASFVGNEIVRRRAPGGE